MKLYCTVLKCIEVYEEVKGSFLIRIQFQVMPQNRIVQPIFICTSLGTRRFNFEDATDRKEVMFVSHSRSLFIHIFFRAEHPGEMSISGSLLLQLQQ